MNTYFVEIKATGKAFSDFEIEKAVEEFIVCGNRHVITSNTFFVTILRALLGKIYKKDYVVNVSYYNKAGDYLGKEIYSPSSKLKIDTIIAHDKTYDEFSEVAELCEKWLETLLNNEKEQEALDNYNLLKQVLKNENRGN